jgi:hypothetical protein
MPNRPYSPSRKDFRRPSAAPDGFWIVPLSTARSGHPRAAATPEPVYDRLHIRLGAEAIAPALEDLLDEPGPRHLVFSLRSSAFLRSGDRDRIAASLKSLATLEGARFVNAAGMIDAVARQPRGG